MNSKNRLKVFSFVLCVIAGGLFFSCASPFPDTREKLQNVLDTQAADRMQLVFWLPVNRIASAGSISLTSQLTWNSYMNTWELCEEAGFITLRSGFTDGTWLQNSAAEINLTAKGERLLLKHPKEANFRGLVVGNYVVLQILDKKESQDKKSLSCTFVYTILPNTKIPRELASAALAMLDRSDFKKAKTFNKPQSGRATLLLVNNEARLKDIEFEDREVSENILSKEAMAILKGEKDPFARPLPPPRKDTGKLLVWRVGSPEEGIPKTDLVDGWKDKAIVVSFDFYDFIEELKRAEAAKALPDVLAFRNYQVLKAVEKELPELYKKMRRCISEKTDSESSIAALNTGGGLEWLFVDSLLHKKTKAIALQFGKSNPNITVQQAPTKEIEEASAAFAKRDLNAMENVYHPDALIQKEYYKKSEVEVFNTRTDIVYGNARFIAAIASISYEAPQALGVLQVGSIWARSSPSDPWKLLVVANDPVSIRTISGNMRELLSSGTSDVPDIVPGKAVLLTKNGVYPQPKRGERFGDFRWKPGENAQVEIVEFNYGYDTRIFCHKGSGTGTLSTGQLWTTGSPWLWRVWSAAKNGEVVFSGTRGFSGGESLSQAAGEPEQANGDGDIEIIPVQTAYGYSEKMEGPLILHPELVASVSATSVLKPGKKATYIPEHLIDDRKETSWVEGKEDDGRGEQIFMNFKPNTVIPSIVILNGYCENEKLWRQNNRVRELAYELTFSDGSRGKSSAILEDNMGYQYIVFSFDKTHKRVPVESITFTILSTYPGTIQEENDTCLALLCP